MLLKEKMGMEVSVCLTHEHERQRKCLTTSVSCLVSFVFFSLLSSPLYTDGCHTHFLFASSLLQCIVSVIIQRRRTIEFFDPALEEVGGKKSE